MKTSLKPTEYLLIKAMTNSEWDDCGFAIINIREEWKQIQKKRLEAVKMVENDYDLKWLNYADTNVEFFKFSEEKYPDVEKWLSEKSRVFIELEKEDFKNFTLPENNLNCYQMQVFKNGNAIYNAFGKHTSEEVDRRIFTASINSIVMKVKDLNGCEIKVTNLDEAIRITAEYKEYEHINDGFSELDKRLNSY